MAEPLDQIRAAIPDLRFRRIGFEHFSPMEQRVPSRHQRTPIEWKGKCGRAVFGAHRRLGHQKRVERLQVGVGRLREMRIRKRRIKMPAVAMDAFAHRAFERRIRPCANPGRGIGGDVGTPDRAEWRLDRAASRVDGTVRIGVTDRAIAERGKLPAASDRRGRIDRCIRPGDRRDRSPRQHGCSDADRCGA